MPELNEAMTQLSDFVLEYLTRMYRKVADDPNVPAALRAYYGAHAELLTNESCRRLHEIADLAELYAKS